MRDISNKINDSAPSASGYLDATEVNSITDELKNIVETAPGGLSLDPPTGPDSSNEMLAQAIVRQAAGGAVFCTASGDASTHTLTIANPNVTPPSILFKGLACRYKPPASNTGTVSINAFGLGPKPLVNHLSAAPAASAIDGRVIDIFYDPAIGSGSWVLPAWANALYVGQTPTSPPSIDSGEGWEVNGENKGKLNFPGLNSNNTPDTNDLFAFHDASANAHKVISYGALASLLGAGGGLLGIEFLSTGSTYSKSSSVSKALIFAIGGGGGGAGYRNADFMSGGGGGGTAIAFVDLSNVSTVNYGIGAGGAGGVGSATGSSGGSTYFGSYATASGGEGGGRGVEGIGGSGGKGTIGLVKLKGSPGGMPHQGGVGGNGGASFFGGGGRGGDRASGLQPENGGTFGGGGGGADAGQSAGAGSPGCILILEFA